MNTLLTRFDRALTGLAAQHRRALHAWCACVLADDSLVELAALSRASQLRYVLELARIKNEELNSPFQRKPAKLVAVRE